MPLVRWEKEETVAVLTMDTEANRHNVHFAREMLAALDQILEDPGAKALVLASSDAKNWSLGVDLEWLMARQAEKDAQSIKDFMYGMNDVFKRLMLYPMPTIAQISGHAFGNGAILACACDFRFMRSDKGYFCFPEVDLGIPFMPGMDAFVGLAIPRWQFDMMKFTGKRTTAPELEENHVIVKACDGLEELEAETMAFAATFDKKRGIFAEMKKRLYRDVVGIMDTLDPPLIEKLFLMVND